MQIQFRVRPCTDDKVTVYARVLLAGERVGPDKSTHVQGPAADWVPGEYYFKGKTNLEANNKLRGFETQLRERIQRAELLGPLTATSIREAISPPRAVVKLPDLSELCAMYAQKKMKGKAQNTVKSYRSWLNGILRAIRKLGDGPATIVDNDYLERVNDFFLSAEGGDNQKSSTRHKKVTRLARVVNFAIQKKLCPPVAVPDWRPELDEEEDPICLTLRQIEALERRQERDTEKVRDFFLFCCETGLCYSDAGYFSPEHHLLEKDGRTWVKIGRTKTGEIAILPYTDKARRIAEKYGNRAPSICLTEVNRKLKTLAARAGIRENLTSHVARKTKALALLDAGISEQVVNRMMGWRSNRTIRRYARVSIHAVETELLRAKVL